MYKMRELGGYIELDTYHLPMLHEDGIALNSARNCLAYLIRARKIKKIMLPFFLCDSVKNICDRENVSIRYYHVGYDFFPKNIHLLSDEWLYIVDYYGQLSPEQISKFKNQYKRVIVDEVQGYYKSPLKGVDTIYTCRKFFGVPDGAFVYTDAILKEPLEIDYSMDRMYFLLGRYEKNASDYYQLYVENNHLIDTLPLRFMSRLTRNLLHGIDYEWVKKSREINWKYLQKHIGDSNKLRLQYTPGPFMYPLLIKNGFIIRKRLQRLKIYIPVLWPNVITDLRVNLEEKMMAENILPLPCDQRYTISDMEYLVKIIREQMN